MGILRARIKILCPDTNTEVDMIKSCVGESSNPPCKYYNHWGSEGNKIYVSCEKKKGDEFVEREQSGK